MLRTHNLTFVAIALIQGESPTDTSSLRQLALIIGYKDLVLLPLGGKMLKDCFSFRTSYGIHITLHFNVSLTEKPYNSYYQQTSCCLYQNMFPRNPTQDKSRFPLCLSYALKQHS